MALSLTLEESHQGALEAKAAKLSDLLDRPVFICAGQTILNTTANLYRLPGEPESEYRNLAPLWFFLSDYKESNCIKRESSPRGRQYDLFYFDPTVSQSVRVVVPLKKGESARAEHIRGAYNQVGLRLDSNPGSKIPIVSMEDTELVENGLSNYVQTLRNHPRRPFQGISFSCSAPYQRPDRIETTWHLDKTVRKGNYSETPFQMILPPGGYNDEVKTLDEATRYMIIEQEPGGCIVCHGSSGQRRHFATLVFAPGAAPRDLICDYCFKAFATQVMNLLDGRPENTPITPGCWMESPNYGEVVCTEINGSSVYFRYKAHRPTYGEEGEITGYKDAPIWVANGDSLAACSFLREADEESLHVLALKGPYGEG